MLRTHIIRTGKKEVVVRAHPKMASRLLNEDRDALSSLERELKARILVREDINFHREETKLE